MLSTAELLMFLEGPLEAGVFVRLTGWLDISLDLRLGLLGVTGASLFRTPCFIVWAGVILVAVLCAQVDVDNPCAFPG